MATSQDAWVPPHLEEAGGALPWRLQREQGPGRWVPDAASGTERELQFCGLWFQRVWDTPAVTGEKS